METLYIFLDESGNFDFTPSGTSYFVLTAVVTTDPLRSASTLQSLKYKMLSDGSDIEYFHASPDRQEVRDEALSAIASIDCIRYHHIYFEKRKANVAYRTPSAVYGLCGQTLLKYIFTSTVAKDYRQIVIVFDKALSRKEQEAFLKSVKPGLKDAHKSYRIYFHQTMADFNGQIADYGAWSKYVSLTRDEQRPMRTLSSISQTDFDLFSKETINYN